MLEADTSAQPTRWEKVMNLAKNRGTIMGCILFVAGALSGNLDRLTSTVLSLIPEGTFASQEDLEALEQRVTVLEEDRDTALMESTLQSVVPSAFSTLAKPMNEDSQEYIPVIERDYIPVY